MARIARRDAIMQDRGGDRLTRVSTDDTCLREQWMVGHGAAAWRERLAAFHARNPGCTVVDEGFEAVDDLARWPACRGGYGPGDVVVTTDANGDRVAREVVDGDPDARPGPFGEPGDRLRLEDGSTLAWHDGSNGWFVHDPMADRRRARPPLPGEPVDDLRPGPATLGRRGLDAMIAALDRLAGEWDEPTPGNTHPDQVALVMHRAALRADSVWSKEQPGYMAHAHDALRDASAWLARMLAEGRAHDRPWPSTALRDAARIGGAVCDALERRSAPSVTPGP